MLLRELALCLHYVNEYLNNLFSCSQGHQFELNLSLARVSYPYNHYNHPEITQPPNPGKYIDHIVSRLEQHPILNFAVPFLKMLTIYMLWRAQFSPDVYAVFFVHQILILLPLYAEIWGRRCPKKSEYLFYFWL